MRIFPVLVILLASTAFGQTPTDRIVVPLTDPSRPATLEVSLLSGGITVAGWDGKEIVIQTDTSIHRSGDEHDEETHEEEEEDDRARGLRRIPNFTSGLEVEEGDNFVSVASHNHRNVDLLIQVPRACTVTLSTVNDGDIVVRDVSGEITAENTNGDVMLSGIIGAAVVHALNGEIEAKLTRLDPKKSCSFSSLNGDIDVTLPADSRVDLQIKTDNGEVYTDFDLQLGPKTTEVQSDDGKSRKSKKRRYGYETSMVGSLNGGGASLRLQTFNGSIYLRKGK